MNMSCSESKTWIIRQVQGMEMKKEKKIEDDHYLLHNISNYKLDC